MNDVLISKEDCLYPQIATQDLSRHHIIGVCLNHLLPRILRIGNHEAELKVHLLNFLIPNIHFLQQLEIFNFFLRGKNDFSGDFLTLEDLFRESKALLLCRLEVH